MYHAAAIFAMTQRNLLDASDGLHTVTFDMSEVILTAVFIYLIITFKDIQKINKYINHNKLYITMHRTDVPSEAEAVQNTN